MSIKPIDMQVNIGQMHEVAKSEQARSAAAIELQQVLDSESGKKSREAPTKVEENKKVDNAVITNEERDKGRRSGGGKRGKEKKATEPGNDAKDERMGLFIDILK